MVPEKIDWRLIVPANSTNFSQISSERFQELLSSNKKATFLFFLNNLRVIIKPNPHPKISTAEINYMAKFLTRISMTTDLPSISDQFFIHFPTFDSMANIYSNLRKNILGNVAEARFLEMIACQILFFSGFYYDDAVRHFDRNEMEKLGRDYFTACAIENKRKRLLEKMAKNFKTWQDFLCYLNWRFAKLREEALLIQQPKLPEPLIKLTGK